MAALVAAIHVAPPHGAEMDARIKSAHDGVGVGREKCPDTRNESRHDEWWGRARAAPDYGAVEGAGGVGQHRGMPHQTTREHSHAMQDEAPKSTTAGTFGRSSIDRLPPKLRKDRERAAEKAAQANQPKRQGGLSPEAVAIIRAEVEGDPPPPPPAPRTVTSVPVDPWNPAEFPAVPVNPDESHSIPDNPGESHLSPANPYESWTEIAPRVYRTSPTSILSLGPAEKDARIKSAHDDVGRP